jgi:hypothetical protein
MPAPKGHAPYPGCETGGRPKRYSIEDIERFADELTIWIKIEKNFWYKDFCHEKGLHPQFMSEWAKENHKFREAYELAKSIQESKIFKGSMLDNYNVTMSKMALTNWHGWKDKNETRISGDTLNPIAVLFENTDGTTKELVTDESR